NFCCGSPCMASATVLRASTFLLSAKTNVTYVVTGSFKVKYFIVHHLYLFVAGFQVNMITCFRGVSKVVQFKRFVARLNKPCQRKRFEQVINGVHFKAGNGMFAVGCGKDE